MSKYILTILFFFFIAWPIWAVSSIESSIKKYQISFPIQELGGCTDFDSCRNFCENQANRRVCVNYAKQKGFYKEEEIKKNRSEIIDAAQAELGCTTNETCKNLCENEANFEKCTEFAKRHNLGGGQILSPKNQDIVNKAKSILGCDSPSSCKAFCENKDNRDKCRSFMQQAGLPIKDDGRTGPGGCDSPESCDAYCADKAHTKECEASGDDPTGKSTKRKDSIAACENLGPEECKSYCITHPEDCPGFWAEGGYKGPEDEYKTGDDFCRANPDKCPGPGGQGQWQESPPEQPPALNKETNPMPEVKGISTQMDFQTLVVLLFIKIFGF